MKYLRELYRAALVLAFLTTAACFGSPRDYNSESRAVPANQVIGAGNESLIVTLTPSNSSVHPDGRKSWMESQAKNARLLYVSDVGTDDVDVYAYNTGKLVGQLTGFDEPQGLCVDSQANVYVSNTLASTIVGFAHGSSTPFETLNDPGQLPVDCALIRFGDIVVANMGTTTGGPGSLSYYQGSSLYATVSSPRIAKISSIAYLPVVGFNFMTATNKSGQPQYAKFRFAWNLLSTPFASPGGIRFSGIHKDMAVGDQAGTIYLVRGNNLSAKVQLKGLCAAGQFSVTRTNIAVPDPCGGKVLIYAFPKGGRAVRIVTDSLLEPMGTVVSPNDIRGP